MYDSVLKQAGFPKQTSESTLLICRTMKGYYTLRVEATLFFAVVKKNSE